MGALLCLMPALPLAGFIILVAGARLSRRAVALIGAGSAGAAAAAALAVAAGFILVPPPDHAVSVALWDWIRIGKFAPRITLYLDPLALVMALVVTVVGFLIHLYSVAFMARQGTPEGEGYRRFFACMNLFIAAMLVLVLADNLLLLYLGWEGVGLCSYLLIGFWYKEQANGRAAIKAFVVTRVGDAALAIALFLLAINLGTLHIQDVCQRAVQQWPPGSALAVASALLLLGGAVGKSAQLPLQTWLPDAMAGPTPVSALIHAATMVTAGVYLMARLHILFELAPAVQLLVALIGAATLLLAGCSALVQRDIKRVLAYSTMSQVGYMFLALGAGAWGAAIYHLTTHAFFKSLLFLGAGVVMAALRDEHDLFKMGGLWKKMPVTFWTFLAAAFALASLPPATAGFSKELILSQAYGMARWGAGLYAAGLAGVFITAFYTFRMLFLAFLGAPHASPEGRPGPAIMIPLIALALACVFGGLLGWPAAPGGRPFLTAFLDAGNGAPALSVRTELILGLIGTAAAFAGALAAYVVYLRSPGFANRWARTAAGAALRQFWFEGWGFDRLYAELFIRPFVFLAQINRNDFIDLVYQRIAAGNEASHRALALLQNGAVRRYAAGLALGAVLIVFILVFL